MLSPREGSGFNKLPLGSAVATQKRSLCTFSISVCSSSFLNQNGEYHRSANAETTDSGSSPLVWGLQSGVVADSGENFSGSFLNNAAFLTTFGTWPGILRQREARRMLSTSGAVTKFFFALDENPPLKNSEA
jgi:hypothetical protein